MNERMNICLSKGCVYVPQDFTSFREKNSASVIIEEFKLELLSGVGKSWYQGSIASEDQNLCGNRRNVKCRM